MVSFGFVSGILVGAVGALLALTFWRRGAAAGTRPRVALAAGVVAMFAVAGGILYYVTGATHSGAPHVAGEMPGAGASSGGGSNASTAPARSMQDAVAGLEARLARGEGSDADWTLLAQAYEFLGRKEDAQRARTHTLQPGVVAAGRMSAGALAATADAMTARAAPGTAAGPAGPGTPMGTAGVAGAEAALAERVKNAPNDGTGWLALAEVRRLNRDTAGARAAYDKAIALGSMTAQSWADYADVLGTLAGGSLLGDPGRAIDRALALDPANTKALWLKASVAFEEHHYAESLTFWRKLRGLLPPNSPDAPVIDANIAEAVALAAANPASGRAAPGAGSGATAGSGTGTPQGAELSGTVSVDPRLTGRVSRDATLYIYAKAADAPGPPLAVMRTTAAAWPVSFRLDDSMAMMPSRRLSQFENVVVEARISRSGQATPSAGDLYVTSPVVRPGPGTRLALVINREIG